MLLRHEMSEVSPNLDLWLFLGAGLLALLPISVPLATKWSRQARIVVATAWAIAISACTAQTASEHPLSLCSGIIAIVIAAGIGVSGAALFLASSPLKKIL